MNRALVFALGVGAGVLATSYLMRASSCCDTVAGAVREKVGVKLGPTAQAVGDALGAWKPLAGFVSELGLS